MMSPSVSRVPQQSQNTANIFSSLIIFFNYIWCGIAKSVARVGNAVPDLRCHGISYLLARSSLYASFAVTYPSDVILVSHILSIPLCAVRGSLQRDLPIRRSVQTMPWNTLDVGKAVMCVARKGFSLPTIRINISTINTFNIDGVVVTIKINIYNLVVVDCYFHFAMIFTQKFKAVYNLAYIHILFFKNIPDIPCCLCLLM